ncbi:uncharacterized protein BX663DRAFT_308772 [Cokeromyces recurvatus]|uniref:uncharacterized protein n=1 Tax=Cokeromyces recurvatus TaxID=90255 RepID=UPI00221F7F17|nr:uncharacterized protein BX663DRAFT_308772 [Cokeromyces recurvatus]KAI7905041.1 hypothetical protein BX663DRAFT_308772 [Cokeromyces recurvatus]
MKKRILEGRQHLSVNFIGVLPAARRRGEGGALLKYVLKKADVAQLPIFAEVWGQDCLNWFQKFDFVIHDEKSLSDKEDIRIYYMVREPRMDPETPKILSAVDAMAALHLEPPREDALTALQKNEE